MNIIKSSKGFWKNGLSSAWGDPNLVTNTTILKYRWPSVGSGWEKGLISFSKAQIMSLRQTPSASSAQSRDEEANFDYLENRSYMQLLQDVLELPNTKVVIIHGNKDFVVPLKNSERLANEFSNLRLIVLDGQGHDPFEEKVPDFIDAVESIFIN